MTIAEFCHKHNACSAGREWALRKCKTLGDVWRTAKPEWLLWVATRPGVLDDVTLRMFAVECARSVQHLLTDKRSIAAIDVAERYALGEATNAELDAAKDAAWVAASDAARAAARAAARGAAWYAAWAAARAAAMDAAWDAAWATAMAAAMAAARGAAWDAARVAARAAASAAASDAAWAAARAAAMDAARAAQAEWLRASAEPCFDGGAKLATSRLATGKPTASPRNGGRNE